MSPLQTYARRYRRLLHLGLGVAAVGMLLWGRLILKEAPRTATADGPLLIGAAADGPAESPITGRRELLDFKQGKLGPMDDQVVSQSKSDVAISDDFGQMQAAQPAAAELNLQGVTTGKVPVARINGRMVRVGETVEGFTLRSVVEQTAVLERDGAVLRLTTPTSSP